MCVIDNLDFVFPVKHNRHLRHEDVVVIQSVLRGDRLLREYFVAMVVASFYASN